MQNTASTNSDAMRHAAHEILFSENEDTGRQLERCSAPFKMPECSFDYDRCGICRYYSTLNLSGYCDYWRRKVSSTDTACAQYS